VPQIDMRQLDREDAGQPPRSMLSANNPHMSSPRLPMRGQFSGAGRPGSPIRGRPQHQMMGSVRPMSASSASRSKGPALPQHAKAHGQALKLSGDQDFNASDSKAFRVGGGFVSRPPPVKPPPSPQRLDKDDPKLRVAKSIEEEAAAPPKRLNERQWETVVTRLYGTPGGADDPMNRNKQKDNNNAKKMHPVAIERAVDRLYNPNPRKQEWLLEQRVAILDKELRSCQAKPRISKTSERMASGKLHIVDRVDAIIQERQQKMAELISSVEQEEGGAIKGSPYISPRAKAMPRTYQDLMSWDAERTERLQQQREAKVVDEISCPFQPEIDEYSEELALRRFHKEGLSSVPAEERLYSLRELPTEAQVRTARLIHQEDLKHSLALSAQ